MRSILIFFIITIHVSCKSQQLPVEKVGKIHVLDNDLLTWVDSNAFIEVLAEGFTWSEGPLWLPTENKVIFSDVPENTIYSWDEKKGKAIYLKPSGLTMPDDSLSGKGGANGLALDSEGKLIICQHGNRAVAKMDSSLDMPLDRFTFLATTYQGKKFSSPNDLYIAADKSIFFTDPPYGLPDQDQSKIKKLRYNGIYRLLADGQVLLLDSTLTRPNGIALSKDEKTMIVANSDPKKAVWYTYGLDKDKNIISKGLFADKTMDVASKKGLPDGLKIHSSGTIFATGPGGVLVFDASGKHLGTIDTGQATANCGFDADENYLYMTAHSYLLRIKLKKGTR